VLSDRWTVDLDEHGAPALLDHVRTGRVQVGALLHDPQDRDRSLGVVLLAIMRRDQVLLAPPDDEPLAENDRLLLIGEPQDRRALDTVLSVPAAAEYVLSGRRIGQSWVWRTLVDR
jgi:NhaP-type Na+/H+ and K+/H+ antiporter